MRPPITTAAIAANSTIPAATSFATFASGCIDGDARSTAASMAVLSPSRISTDAMVSTTIAHSPREILSHQPSPQAINATMTWMRAVALRAQQKPQPGNGEIKRSKQVRALRLEMIDGTNFGSGGHWAKVYASEANSSPKSRRSPGCRYDRCSVPRRKAGVRGARGSVHG